jgi:hypothetical protein
MKLVIGARDLCLAASVVLLWASAATAAPFSSPDNLVVIRVGTGSGYDFDKTQSVHMEEYGDVGGASLTLKQTIDLPSRGPTAVTLPGDNNHDGILNRSADGRYLVFGGYRADAGIDNPNNPYLPLVDPLVNRVVARIASDGSVDSSTMLTDGSFSLNTIRAVATDDGSRFWIAGDNADNEQCCNTNGGLRYVASLGAPTSVNLSQVQVSGGALAPDNVRDVDIFAGQLYDSSGSNATIGKATLQVGTGLPTATESTPQTLTKLTTDGASTNAFFLADLSPTVPGLDTLYSSVSSPGEGIRKYSKSCVGDDCTWNLRGFKALTVIGALAASVSGSTVNLFATDGSKVYRLTDSSGFDATLNGAFTDILTAGPDEYFRGLAFAPSAAVALTGDFNGDGQVDAADYTVWRDTLGSMSDLRANGDDTGTSMGKIDQADYLVWKASFGMGSGASANAALSAQSAAVPEPATWIVSGALGTLLALVRRGRRADGRATRHSIGIREIAVEV